MAYVLTPEQAASITDVEMAFSTDRLLPPWDEIPNEFRRGNQYTRLAEAIFYGTAMPDNDIALKPGFTADALNRTVRAHLTSFGPKHEHKIAGVGYLISLAATLVSASSQKESTA